MYKVAWITLFFFISQLTLPCLLYANEAENPNETQEFRQDLQKVSDPLHRVLRNAWLSEKSLSPEQQQVIIDSSTNDTFEGNPTLRIEDSSILRPTKQVALQILDGEVGIVQTFLAFQATQFLSSFMNNTASKKVVAKVHQVLAAMTPAQIFSFESVLKRLGIEDKFKTFNENPKPKVRNFMRTEGRFMAMTLIGGLITMGLYDGLDVNGIKDSILALDPMEENMTVGSSLLAVYMMGAANRHFYGFFNNRFDLFYDKLLDSKGFGSQVLKLMDKKADAVGRKHFKAANLGGGTRKDATFAKRMGLVGVGEGTQFTLRGLLRHLGAGIAFGVVGNVIVQTAFLGTRGMFDSVINGANRNLPIERPEYPEFIFQKSGDAWQDGLNERRHMLLMYYEDYLRSPITHISTGVTTFAGAYTGSVVAGAMMAGAGLPTLVVGVMVASLFSGIGAWLGSWSATKFERSDWAKKFKRARHEKKLLKIIKKMNLYTEGRITDSEAHDLALDRSWDMYHLEAKGQAYVRMYLVEDFSKVEFYKNNGYVYMKLDKAFGEPFDLQANIRYPLIDMQGHEGYWDLATNQIYDVGKVMDNNGFKLIFITDNDQVFLDGEILETREDSEFRMLSNGLIMTPSDFDRSKWVIRSQDINTDVFLRNRKQRYAFDPEDKVYRRVGTSLGRSINPLAEFLEILHGNERQVYEKLTDRLEGVAEKNQVKALDILERVSGITEGKFFLQLLDHGASKAKIDHFLTMDTSQWKMLLLGKLQRRLPSKIEQVLAKISETTLSNLKSSLEAELEDSETQSLWDSVSSLLSPYSLIASITN
jgi:hypothetical protein